MSETTLTKDDLKAVLKANSDTLIEVIRELKKPNEIEQARIDAEQRDIEAKQRERLDNAESVKAEIVNRRQMKRICSHEHPNGDTHCVWVQEKTGAGYLLCQKNQCKIRPGAAPAGFQGDDIFDSAMFNRIFQKLNTSGADIIG